MVRYEWIVEEVDQHDDIIDTFAWYTPQEMIAAIKHPIADGLHYEFGVVRDSISNDGELIDRQWAYVENGKLPDEFDGGSKVPKNISNAFYKAQ